MNKRLLVLASVLLLAFVAGPGCSSPEEKAAGYIASAQGLFDANNLDKAELEYKNALQINQNLPEAWFGLAKIHERKQEWRKAYATLNKVRELAPQHVDARIMLAQILLASNQIDQALEDTQEILEMAPDNSRAHSLMAAVNFRLENNDGARQEVEKALAIDPNNNEALLVRARVDIAEKKYDAAIALLEQAIAKNPENVSLYLMKIQAHAETGDKKAVEDVYVALVSQFPENSAFKMALAQHYIGEENIDAAEKIMQQLVQANPDSVDEKLRLVGFRNQYRSADAAVELLKGYIDSSPDEYRLHFALGELYERNQQVDEALEVYEGIVASDGLQPSGLDARTRIALIELRRGNRERAQALADEVLAQDQNNENALLLQAGFHIADGKYDDALVSARTVLRDNPDSVKALGLLAQAYSATGSRELAIESFTKAFNLNPGAGVIANQLAGVYIQQRDYQKADEVLQESISRGNNSVDALRLLTQVKLSLGEWDVAEQLARQLQKVEGQEALSQQVLGVVYQGKEQREESIEAFKRAHELAPESSRPLLALVQTYVRNGEIDEARRFLDSVLSVDSDNATAFLLLGQLSLYENDAARAIEHFNKAIEIEPRMEAAYRTLGAVYTRQGNIEMAEKTIRRGIEALPDRPILTINLASVYERQQNYAEAIRVYEGLLEKNPQNLIAKNNLASLLTDHVGDQAALDRARQIAAEFKTSQIPQFQDTYAWASVKAGFNLEEAVAILEGIVEDNENVGVYRYHLGEALRKKGDAQQAKIHLAKAIELEPDGSSIAADAKKALQQVAQ